LNGGVLGAAFGVLVCVAEVVDAVVYGLVARPLLALSQAADGQVLGVQLGSGLAAKRGHGAHGGNLLISVWNISGIR